MSKSTRYATDRASRSPRSVALYLVAGGILALSLGAPMPFLQSPLALPAAYAHHGGGGGVGGGAGGGRGDRATQSKPAGATRSAPADGYGKGGRGLEGLKP